VTIRQHLHGAILIGSEYSRAAFFQPFQKLGAGMSIRIFLAR